MQISNKNNKKSLKIAKGKSESVNLGETDNTMGKRKKYKRKNNDLQNIQKKVKNIPPAINSFVIKLLRSSLQSDVNATEGH